ncbi:MAG: hypothetical protein ACPKQO_04725 [Nitrososphaeraceae archaeon]
MNEKIMQYPRVKSFGLVFIILFSIIITSGFFGSMMSINDVYGAEFVNEEFDIKFEYPDGWKLISYENKTSGIEYDKIGIVSFNPVPDPTVKHNFVQLDIYTDMPNLEQFVKTVKKELISNNNAEIQIQDIVKYSEYVVGIYANYTPILKQSGLSSDIQERVYWLFQRDGIGYNLSFSLPPFLYDKHLNPILSIPSQIINNFTNN